jgi:hypothetical protein
MNPDYEDWLTAIRAVAVTNDEVFASVDNLTGEDRVSLEDLEIRIGAKFTEEVAKGGPTNQAALCALQSVQCELCEPAHPKLGAIPAPAGHGATLITHINGDDLSYIDPTLVAPGDRVSLFAAGKAARSGTWKVRRRFIWVTFPDVYGRTVPSTPPAQAVRELGLGHMKDATAVYRLDFPHAAGTQAFIPTVLDAGINCVWQKPPAGTKEWGMTRDLADGSPKWPELVVETKDYMRNMVGVVLKNTDGSTHVNVPAINYRSNRPQAL